MLLDVSLAGFSSPWLFRGSGQFSVWAEERPWLREGGLCVIRVESDDTVYSLIPSASRFVHGLNSGDSRLDIRHIECGGQAASPVQLLLREFELDPAIGPFEARDRIKASLLDRSMMLIFSELAPVQPSEWEELVNLLEYYRKSANPVCLCAIVIDSRGTVNSQPVCDFLTGRPSHQVLSHASSMLEETAAWSAYVHHRVAWEAGGSLAYATFLSEELATCSSCDDEDLEAGLQESANSRLANHPGLKQLCELAGIEKSAAKIDSATQRALRAELLASNLLWRPPMMNSLHVVPWASRALLAMPKLPRQQVWTLRHNLVCAPLAGEILSLCLKFESQIQAKLHGQQDRSFLASKTVENQRRFNNGEDGFIVYPKGFPAPPNGAADIWAFATLGETLKASPSSEVAKRYWDTLHLRNAVAHGHYVAWHHVRLAQGLLKYFDTTV